MDFRILGPLVVLHEGTPVLPAGSRQRALLAFLVLHVNEPVSSASARPGSPSASARAPSPARRSKRCASTCSGSRRSV